MSGRAGDRRRLSVATTRIKRMVDALAGPAQAEADALSAAGLLAMIRDRKMAEDRAAADQLDLAARWADLHPPESIHSAAAFSVPGSEHEEPIAGAGCPLVAEFCIAELGTVLGISTVAAKKLIGHALELRHRLPRLWAQVQLGRVPAWRARLVAETTIHSSPALTADAARFVDGQVAAVAGRIGTAQLDRLVAETIKRFDLAEADPAADPEDGYLSVDPRHVTIHDQDVHFAGTMRIEAELDLADALDLDRALAHGAAVQKALGSDLPLDSRRAKALGDLARTQTALDLFSQGHTTAKDHDGLPVAREVVLHAHFNATAATDGTTVFGPTGRMQEGQRLLLLDQLQSWCGDSRTKVTVKPVIDLHAELSTPAYEVPDRIREQVVLRDGTCVFPWCTRPARGGDVDHVVEFDHDAAAESPEQPGPTATSNLAALCRSHHRLKTHSAWRYEMAEPGVFVWTSPHGHHYRRDRHGTTALDPPDPGPPRIPRQRRP
jgi:5-methylcytosine-specific restriction endonuclease McrA